MFDQNLADSELSDSIAEKLELGQEQAEALQSDAWVYIWNGIAYDTEEKANSAFYHDNPQLLDDDIADACNLNVYAIRLSEWNKRNSA